MDKEPLVSVCVACYNHQNYVADFLESLLDQTYSNIEVIIADDCSTDNSVSIIKSYLPKLEKKFTNVSFKANKTNLGITKNSNNLMRAATGKYYKSMASDDVFYPEAIEKMVEFMEEHEECGLLLANVLFVGDSYKYKSNGGVIGKGYKKSIKDKLESEKLCYNLLDKNFIHAPGVMIRKSVIEKYGCYDESMIVEDYEYWLRLSRKVKFGYIDEPLVYYRRGESSISNVSTKNGKKKMDSMIASAIQVKSKYIYMLKPEKRQNFYSRILNSKIRDCISMNYIDLAIKVYNTAKKKGIPIDYSLWDIILRKNVF